MTEETKKIIQYKRKFLQYYQGTIDPEIKEIYDQIIKTDHFYMMNCTLQYNYMNYDTGYKYDTEKGMPYVIFKGKRIYFPLKYDRGEVEQRFIALLREQDSFSPHRYLDDVSLDIIRKVKSEGQRIITIECGAMEGMFSIDLVDLVDEVHLFECDEDWVVALRETFMPWGDKITISNKMICNYSDDKHIALDDCRFSTTESSFFIIKMDIEGAERYALEGMKKLLEECKDYLLFVCTYHKKDDEEFVRRMFRQDEIWNNRGYFCFYVSNDYEEPYVRRCVLKIKKRSKDYLRE